MKILNKRFSKKRLLLIERYLFLCLIAAMIGLFLLPIGANRILMWAGWQPRSQTIAPLFTEQVQYWQEEIVRWSLEYGLDPNLMATVMQIESCGHPNVVSSAGARGLFQVMPFHFAQGENHFEPNTNALRSANFLRECSNFASGDVGLIFACYNGGPSVVARSFHAWPAETQRYYLWGVGIYIDARDHARRSTVLDEWLQAGGIHLCTRAANELGLN